MKAKKKTLFLVIAALCAVFLTAGCGKVNIGYVDYTRVQQEAPQIKESMDEMKTRMEDFQKDAEKQLQGWNDSGKREQRQDGGKEVE